MVLNYERRFELQKMILSFSKRVEPCLNLESLKKISRRDKYLKCRINYQKIWSKSFRPVKRTFGSRLAKGDAAVGLSKHINHWKAPISGQDLFLDLLKSSKELAGFVPRFAKKLRGVSRICPLIWKGKQMMLEDILFPLV